MSGTKEPDIRTIKLGAITYQLPDGNKIWLTGISGYESHWNPRNIFFNKTDRGGGRVGRNIGGDVDASVTFKNDLPPALLAALTGGKLTTAGCKYLQPEKEFSIVTDDVTLVPGDDSSEDIADVVRVVGKTTGYLYTEVSESPAAGVSFTRLNNVLTFNAAETETAILVTYFYTKDNTADPAGEKVSYYRLSEGAKKIGLMKTDEKFDLTTKTTVAHRISELGSCLINSKVPLSRGGENLKEAGPVTLEFAVDEDADDAWVVHAGYPYPS